MVPLEYITAWALVASLIAYVLLGGADFGGGVLDLLARGPDAPRQRGAIRKAIGPIWEANHVWLIVIIVILFTGFPPAFSAIGIALHVPITLMLMGIIFRGCAFVFRTYDKPGPAERRWGRLFSIASIVSPLLLGVVLGTIASGELFWDQSGVYRSGYFQPWLKPFPWSVGLFALAIFTFLASVYLCVEQRGSDLNRAFRIRAIAAGIAVGVSAGVTWLLAIQGAPLLSAGLARNWWTWPLQFATGAAAIGALVSLWLKRFALARACAVVQVTLIVVGYGAALFPYLVVEQFTIPSTAAPAVTHRLLLAALAIGAAILLPSFCYLFRVFKGERAFTLIDRD
jgi:cytochrome d ubiquinol oxidase subunit II